MVSTATPPSRHGARQAWPASMLAGRTALMIGASRGIGAQAANLLAAAGANLVLAARSRPELDVTARRAARNGAEILVAQTDIGDPAQIEAMVAKATDRFGDIDLVLNLAGEVGPVGRPLTEVSDTDWDTVLSTNLSGPFHLLRAVLPSMNRAGRGRIISISSSAASVPWPRAAPYAASKAGLDQLIRVAAAELDGSGIEFITVLPGATDTPTYDRVMAALAPGLPQWMADLRSGPVADSAVLLLWLCGPGAKSLDGARVSGTDPWVRRQLALFRLRAGPWLEDVLDG